MKGVSEIMNSLSICMIVKNEEDVLARCLDCVQEFADELIIVDTGSTDQTKKIAANYTEHIFDFPWVDDFAAARNFSFRQATKDYVMWLDADDVLDRENLEGLKQLKNTLDPAVDVVMMKYDVAFDENNRPTFSYYRERIVKQSKHFQWVGAIHEVIPTSGNIFYCPLAVSHRKTHPNEPQRNLKIFQKLLAEGKQLDPRQQYYYARELYHNGYFALAIQQFETFLAEGKGWVENNISACKDLAACYNQTQEKNKALLALFHSFQYDTPRAEICCDIGKCLLEQQLYKTAIFWYELATNCVVDTESGGFYLLDCYGYIPYMQLCVCYDKLGQIEQAIKYNEKAGQIKPLDKSYLYNKKYFESQKTH